MTTVLPNPVQLRPNLKFLTDFWNRISAPSAIIEDRFTRRRARSLVVLLIFLNLANIIFAVTLRVADPNVELSSITFFTIVALFITYLISRTRFYQWAAGISVGIISVSLFILASDGAVMSVVWLYYLVIGILLAGLWLSSRAALILLVLDVVGVGILLIVQPKLAPAQVIYPLGFIGITSGIYLFYMTYRDAVERDRQAQISAALAQTKEANDALEQANKDLVRANAIAKESARLKSEFMSTMSHELRTPLNAMIGFCGILLEGMGGEIDEDARHMIERVNSNSNRLLNLINEILDLAKIEAGRMELVSKPLSPVSLADQWRAQMHVLAEQKGLEFKVQVDPDLPETIYGDPERITQIAVNLLSNAFKFTEKGTVTLELKSEGKDWIIRVEDTGVGIPPHAINYIFDEFRQVDGSSRRVYGGTGLGLAIVRNLCLMMNGSVRVTSELDKGSIFTVTLPCIVQSESQTAIAEVA
jgi:signal transduction histidine kinase